jgi:hypothetical protein
VHKSEKPTQAASDESRKSRIERRTLSPHGTVPGFRYVRAGRLIWMPPQILRDEDKTCTVARLGERAIAISMVNMYTLLEILLEI